MAHKRPSWTILEDYSTQDGLPIHKVLQDDTLANKNAVPVLGFKNSLGKLRYPMVDGEDRIVVAMEASDFLQLSERGIKSGGSATMTDITGAELTLVNDLVYKKIGLVVSCFRDSHFQLVWIDDVGGTPVETILADVLTDAGKPTTSFELEGLSFTAGAVGGQTLVVRGKNENAQSDMIATVTAVEIQPAPAP